MENGLFLILENKNATEMQLWLPGIISINLKLYILIAGHIMTEVVCISKNQLNTPLQNTIKWHQSMLNIAKFSLPLFSFMKLRWKIEETVIFSSFCQSRRSRSYCFLQLFYFFCCWTIITIGYQLKLILGPFTSGPKSTERPFKPTAIFSTN